MHKESLKHNQTGATKTTLQSFPKTMPRENHKGQQLCFHCLAYVCILMIANTEVKDPLACHGLIYLAYLLSIKAQISHALLFHHLLYKCCQMLVCL